MKCPLDTVLVAVPTHEEVFVEFSVEEVEEVDIFEVAQSVVAEGGRSRHSIVRCKAGENSDTDNNVVHRYHFYLLFKRSVVVENRSW